MKISFHRRTTPIGFLAVAFCLSMPARAQEDSDIAAARRLFQQATELRAAQDWEGARAKLLEAIAIKETPGLRFHLAHCEEKLGRYLEALADYRRAATLIEDGAVAPDVAALLGPARTSLEERVPTLRVALPRDVQDAKIVLDDRPLEREAAERSARLDPGTHRLEVQAPGRKTFRIEFLFSDGEHRDVEVALPLATEPPAARHPAPPDRERPRAGRSRTGIGLREGVMIGGAALSVAGVVTGVVFLLRANSSSDRVDALQREIDAASDSTGRNCADPGSALASTCGSLDDALSERRTATGVSIAGFAVGAVGAAASVAGWLFWPAKSPAVAVGITPIGPGGAIYGTF